MGSGTSVELVPSPPLPLSPDWHHQRIASAASGTTYGVRGTSIRTRSCLPRLHPDASDVTLPASRPCLHGWRSGWWGKPIPGLPALVHTYILGRTYQTQARRRTYAKIWPSIKIPIAHTQYLPSHQEETKLPQPSPVRAWHVCARALTSHGRKQHPTLGKCILPARERSPTRAPCRSSVCSHRFRLGDCHGFIHP